MTTENIEAARKVALQELEELQAELGEHLLSGGDKSSGSALTKKVQKAKAQLEEIEATATAIAQANDRAEKAARERAEREAQEALERLLQDARADHGELKRKAAAADTAFEAFNQALSDLGGACDDFAERYSELNFQRNGIAILRLRSWNGQILANFKNFGERSFRNFLQQQNIKPTGSGRKITISDAIPDFPRLLVGKNRNTRHEAT